jgi:hypothetical protein
MINKGIPPANIDDFEINYVEDEKTIEITIPKMYLFQNITYMKFGLAMDLQNHLSDKIETVKFIEVYEKMPGPGGAGGAGAAGLDESVMEKVKDFEEEQEGEESPEEEESEEAKEAESEESEEEDE